ncbi:MAG TPA: class I SAM-dependent methyltransferase [Gaiellaceae bacterium]
MEIGDAYGAMITAFHEGGEVVEIIERDDGYIAASRFGPKIYFTPLRNWFKNERAAIRFARGRVLDVGAGAGRVALHLEQRGQSVVAIDNSPGAVDVMRRRGVRDARLIAIEDIGPDLGTFDSVVMFGNNLGLLGGRAKGRRLLRRFHELTPDRGRIVASSLRVYDTDDPVHLAVHDRNRRRGRMGGQLRLRVRFGLLASPWLEYLMLPPEELAELAEPTGWGIARVLDGDGPLYSVVLEKL